MRLTFACGPSGTRLKEFAEHAVSTFRSELSETVFHAHIEDFLPEPIQHVVRHPRRAVVDLWQEAARSAIRAFEAEFTQDPTVKGIITGHLTLFNAVRKEFYSAIDPRILTSDLCEIGQVVILIDDIFDMYLRLRREGEVLDEEVWLEGYLNDNWRSLGYSPPHEFQPEDLDLLRTEYRVGSLQFLLAWRRAELIQAELLARQLGCRFVPLGAKHPREILFPLLEARDEAPTAYISHPITRLRDYYRTHGRWPQFVDQCNTIPRALARLQVVPVMPTSIDELRLQQPKGALLSRWPILDARWPEPEGIGALVESQVGGLHQIFDPEGYQGGGEATKAALAGLMRGLEAAIRAEVPFRDHLLVSATDHLVVFRPLYETGTFSASVQAEIRHWRDLAEAGEPCRIAFLHHPLDVDQALTAIESGLKDDVAFQILLGASQVVRFALKERHSVSATPDQCYQLVRGTLRDALLETWPLGSRDRAELQRAALEYASQEFLYAYLTYSAIGAENVGVFYLASEQEMERQVAEDVAAFVRGESQAPERRLPTPATSGAYARWGAALLNIELRDTDGIA